MRLITRDLCTLFFFFKVQTEASAERFSGQCMYTDLLHFSIVSTQTCYEEPEVLIMFVRGPTIKYTNSSR